MRYSSAILAILAATVVGRGIDVSSGTDVIPPDSKEAQALHHSDKAVKTSPKDKTINGDLIDGGDKFTKSEPKLDHQKLDVPDAPEADELMNPKGSKVKAKGDDHPIVLNDYNPNNLGVADSGKDEKSDSSSSQDSNASGSSGSGSSSSGSLGSSGSSGSSGSGSSGSSSASSSSSSSSSSSGGDKLVSQQSSKNDEGFVSTTAEAPVANSPLHAATMAFSMILFSEVGDKTFLIAALMAMKHSRVAVFTAAISSLAVMTILSAILGHALPALLPKKLTSLLAAGLFIVFGIKLFAEGMALKSGTGVEEELEEVENEIEAQELATQNDDLERGVSAYSEKKGHHHNLKRSPSSPRLSQDGLENGAGDAPLYTVRPGRRSGMFSPWNQLVEGVQNLAELVLSPIWVQVFVMTFLGEWGDRSQISTIAMAAGSDYWVVIVGAILGHAVCTFAAVMGGRLLATKISMRHVTLAGAVAFIVFAIIYFAEGLSLDWTST